MALSSVDSRAMLTPDENLFRSAGKSQWISRIYGYLPYLRVAVPLLLLALIFTWFDFSGIVENLTSISGRFVLAALGITVLQFTLASVRWLLVLQFQGVRLPLIKALSIFGYGALANLILVKSIAGMSVRGALLVKEGIGVSSSAAVIAAERIAALLGLGMAGALGMAYAFPFLGKFFARIELPLHLDLALLGGGLVLVVTAGAFLMRFEPFRRFATIVAKTFSTFSSIALFTAMSALIFYLGFTALALLGEGMGLEIDLLFFISVMPFVAFVTALPVSIGGWGVREGSMVATLALFAIPGEAAVALSISYGLAGVLVTAVFGSLLVLLSVFSHTGDRSAKRSPEKTNRTDD